MSFIEICLSIVLLSIALLGMDAMQVNLWHEQKAEVSLQLAQHQLQNIVERVIISPNDVALFQEDTNLQLAKTLPNGRCKITVNKNNFHIQVRLGKQSSKCLVTKKSGCIATQIVSVA